MNLGTPPPAPRARVVPLGTVAELCAFVDELAPTDAGELVIGGAGAEGSVYVDARRICWAAAKGLARRLTQLLAEGGAVSPVDLEDVYRRCKASGVPLGESLVSLGVTSAPQLRAALAQHTVESLAQLTGGANLGVWHPRAHGAYSARFTFGTAEVLARTGAFQSGVLAAGVEAELRACFWDGEWGAAFVRLADRSRPEPVAWVGEAPLSAAGLMERSTWATSALDLVAAFDAQQPLVAVHLPPARRRRGREVRVAFAFEHTVVVGEVGDQGPARILNRRARARRSFTG